MTQKIGNQKGRYIPDKSQENMQRAMKCAAERGNEVHDTYRIGSYIRTSVGVVKVIGYTVDGVRVRKRNGKTMSISCEAIFGQVSPPKQ